MGYSLFAKNGLRGGPGSAANAPHDSAQHSVEKLAMPENRPMIIPWSR
jgi:hypothetical protein